MLEPLSLYIINSWSVKFIVTTLLLSHISSHVIYLFFIFSFLYLNFSSPYFFFFKKKTLLLPISSHTYYYTSYNLPLFFLPLFLLTILSLYFLSLFYILTLLLPILFCINLISFSHSVHIFPIQNYEYSLSLSLGEFLFFLMILIKVDCFFFFFNIPSKSLFFPFYNFGWILVWVNT